MDRKEEILKYIRDNRQPDIGFLSPLVDDVVFLEEQLEDLRKFPFLQIHPSDKTRQKPTSAAKLYKELLQQYNNCVKLILLKNTGDDEKMESPLRKYMENRVEMAAPGIQEVKG